MCNRESDLVPYNLLCAGKILGVRKTYSVCFASLLTLDRARFTDLSLSLCKVLVLLIKACC